VRCPNKFCIFGDNIAENILVPVKKSRSAPGTAKNAEFRYIKQAIRQKWPRIAGFPGKLKPDCTLIVTFGNTISFRIVWEFLKTEKKPVSGSPSPSNKSQFVLTQTIMIN
jgi:hypothetical protein